MTTPGKVVFSTLLSLSLVCGCSSSRNLQTAQPQAGEKMHYGLKFAKGQSYDIRCISDKSGTQRDHGGLSFRVHTRIGLGYGFDINSVDDSGNAIVDCTVTWVMYQQKMRQAGLLSGGLAGWNPARLDVAYDSSKKNSQTLPQPEGWAELGFVGPKLMAAFLNEKFTIAVTPRGQVQEIRGLDTLRKNIAKKAGEQSFIGQRTQDMNDVELTELLKEQFLRPLSIYPEQPVRVGDSWTRNDTSTLGPCYENKWTLKRRRAGVATIGVDTAIKERQTEEPDPTKSWHGRGAINIDESTGQILGSKTKEDLSVEMKRTSIKSTTVVTFEMTKRKGGVDK